MSIPGRVLDNAGNLEKGIVDLDRFPDRIFVNKIFLRHSICKDHGSGTDDEIANVAFNDRNGKYVK